MDEQFGYGQGWVNRFTQVPNELFEDKCTLNPTCLTVYVYLLSCLNKERNGYTAWPSYTTIASRVRVTKKTVIEAVKVLSEKNYIYKKRRFQNETAISNMYLINHPTVSIDWKDKPAEVHEFLENQK